MQVGIKISNRYEIVDILGIGGMGVVAKAYDEMLKEFVAIKSLKEEYVKDSSVRNRFLNEAKLCLNITHPNIIRVRDVNVFDDIYYMVMEYIDGVDLKNWLKKSNIDEPKELYELIRPIFEALDYAHNFTIHRDIKPANVMVKENRVYLMDFGISKALEDSEIANETVVGAMGTRSYMAPEQAFNASDVDKRCDIYSLGVMFYEMLTRQKPDNVVIKEPVAPSVLNSKIPKELDFIILKMLKVKPEDRYECVKDVIDSIDAILFSSRVNKQVEIKEEAVTKNISNLENMAKIDAGYFFRGSGVESKVEAEKPRKRVFLDEFYICKYCVTNEEYAKFLDSTQKEPPIDFFERLKEFPDHPVVGVSFYEALEYCKFIGATLPTEAQWEKAAKGGKNLIYPWGKGYKDGYANIANINGGTVSVSAYENGINPYGLYQMAGNVWEWCLDDYDEDFYKSSEDREPLFKNGSRFKVVRGGAFDFVQDGARCSFRYKKDAGVKELNVGFRVVVCL